MFKRFRELGAGLFLAKCLKVAGLRLEDAYLKKKRYGTEKNKVFDITVDDIKFKMSFKDYEVNKAIQERIDGVREPETTSIIRSMLKPGDNVLELGGCYGYFTQIMADSVGRSGKIVSIDGLPNNFKIFVG